MKNKSTRRLPLASLALMVSALGLTACTSIGYRCPLEPGDQADSPTACANMQTAMAGAKRGTGGNTSVLMDDKGRSVSAETLGYASPSTGQARAGVREPYKAPSGTPVFEQSKLFQAWSGAFVDGNGNLHDGHNAWFATPGRWAYGSVTAPSMVGDNLLRPAIPTERPVGRVVPTDPRTGAPKAQTPSKAASPAQVAPQDREKAALQNLSEAANSAASKQLQNVKATGAPQAAGGVTAPAVQLNQ